MGVNIDMRMVDLTVELSDGFRSFPTHPKMTIMNAVTHAFSAPRYEAPCMGYASMLMILPDHMGTHVDAPFHFDPKGKTIESLPIGTFVGEAVLLDLSEKPLEMEITDHMLEDYCKKKDISINEDDIVLIRCWHGKWGEEGFHKVRGLHITGARWLVSKGVKLIGTDMSILETHSDNMARPVHMLLLVENEIPIIENLANLDALHTNRFRFSGFPLNIKGLSGSPIRAIAFED